MRRFAIAGLLVLGGCGTAPLTPAQDTAALAAVPRIEARAAAVQTRCARIKQLAPLANAIPKAGPLIAIGAELGCDSAQGIARLVADPAGAERLARHEEALKAALAEARMVR